jgi:hypothetical protein
VEENERLYAASEEAFNRLSLAALSPLAAQTISDFATKADGCGLVITQYTGQGGDISIPETIYGKTIASIGWPAFSGCSSLKLEVHADIERRFGSMAFT